MICSMKVVRVGTRCDSQNLQPWNSVPVMSAVPETPV